MRLLTTLLLIILMTGTASAATITGTVYNYNLEPVPGAIVTANTTPEQTLVARDGTYRLHLPAGTYRLSVNKVMEGGLKQHHNTTITVTEEGEYTYDLILFPETEEIETPGPGFLEGDEETPEEEEAQAFKTEHALLLLLGLALIGVGGYRYLRRKKTRKEETADPFAEKILQHIKREKTISQKDLRKHYVESEAAISTAIARLESEGRIRKVKRGRGNILIYQR
ncbi:carboxypeptidase regulatory-like domain-containing protein [Candidatus Woesearchaeota archaeon]|nr:carboxypeptidase regulatory-like domain-containing protein [Candidatus Woesearchaeota archaeon]